MKLTIVSAKPQDAQDISAIAMRSKAHWGYDDAFMLQVKHELTYAAADIQPHPTFKAVKEGVMLGFYQLIHVDETTIELDALFVEPEYIGTGLGAQLFYHAVDQARHSGYQTMGLQSEPYAEGFYHKQGCIKVGEKPSLSIAGRVLPSMVYDLTQRK